jgi:hypothetical protein
VTEAGFGADIGMEKFFDIKCRYSGLIPQVHSSGKPCCVLINLAYIKPSKLILQWSLCEPVR